MTKNKLKIRKIGFTLTRQVVQYQPLVCSIEAELDDNDDPNEVAKALKRAVISVVYSDMPDERNKMIARLVGKDESPVIKATEKDSNEVHANNVQFGKEQDKVKLNNNLTQTPKF